VTSDKKISGLEKTAILLLALGDKFTEQIFRRLDREEIVNVSRSMLEMESIPKKKAEEVLKEFNQTLISDKEIFLGGPYQVNRMLTEFLDEDTARHVKNVLGLNYAPAPFMELINVSPRLLSCMLLNEHPQTLALIAGHIPPENAAELLQNFPPEIRSDVFVRLAGMEAVPHELLIEVDEVLKKQLIAIDTSEDRKAGGTKSVAEILNFAHPEIKQEMLAEIEQKSSKTADDIRELIS